MGKKGLRERGEGIVDRRASGKESPPRIASEDGLKMKWMGSADQRWSGSGKANEWADLLVKVYEWVLWEFQVIEKAIVSLMQYKEKDHW